MTTRRRAGFPVFTVIARRLVDEMAQDEPGPARKFHPQAGILEDHPTPVLATHPGTIPRRTRGSKSTEVNRPRPIGKAGVKVMTGCPWVFPGKTANASAKASPQEHDRATLSYGPPADNEKIRWILLHHRNRTPCTAPARIRPRPKFPLNHRTIGIQCGFCRSFHPQGRR